MSRIFVHPGYVTSKTDGDRHFIGYMQLCRLYGLNPNTAFNASRPEALHGIFPRDDDEHYYPKEDGDYQVRGSDE